MRTDRLLLLAEFLEALPRRRFDFARWVGDDWKGDPFFSCGTTACAFGHATTIPAFRRAGLRMTEFNELSTMEPVFRGYLGVSAAAKFFEVNYREARFLFYPNSNLREWESPAESASPKTVARHIRRFAAWKEEATDFWLNRGVRE